MKKKELKPGGGPGIRIRGTFVDEEKKEVYRKKAKAYKKMPKTKPCGFHRVMIENLCVRAGATTILENVN